MSSSSLGSAPIGFVGDTIGLMDSAVSSRLIVAPNDFGHPPFLSLTRCVIG
jgi:hypothetical protein